MIIISGLIMSAQCFLYILFQENKVCQDWMVWLDCKEDKDHKDPMDLLVFLDFKDLR